MMLQIHQCRGTFLLFRDGTHRKNFSYIKFWGLQQIRRGVVRGENLRESSFRSCIIITVSQIAVHPFLLNTQNFKECLVEVQNQGIVIRVIDINGLAALSGIKGEHLGDGWLSNFILEPVANPLLRIIALLKRKTHSVLPKLTLSVKEKEVVANLPHQRMQYRHIHQSV